MEWNDGPFIIMKGPLPLPVTMLGIRHISSQFFSRLPLRRLIFQHHQQGVLPISIPVPPQHCRPAASLRVGSFLLLWPHRPTHLPPSISLPIRATAASSSSAAGSSSAIFLSSPATTNISSPPALPPPPLASLESLHTDLLKSFVAMRKVTDQSTSDTSTVMSLHEGKKVEALQRSGDELRGEVAALKKEAADIVALLNTIEGSPSQQEKNVIQDIRNLALRSKFLQSILLDDLDEHFTAYLDEFQWLPEKGTFSLSLSSSLFTILLIIIVYVCVGYNTEDEYVAAFGKGYAGLRWSGEQPYLSDEDRPTGLGDLENEDDEDLDGGDDGYYDTDREIAPEDEKRIMKPSEDAEMIDDYEYDEANPTAMTGRRGAMGGDDEEADVIEIDPEAPVKYDKEADDLEEEYRTSFEAHIDQIREFATEELAGSKKILEEMRKYEEGFQATIATIVKRIAALDERAIKLCDKLEAHNNAVIEARAEIGQNPAFTRIFSQRSAAVQHLREQALGLDPVSKRLEAELRSPKYSDLVYANTSDEAWAAVRFQRIRASTGVGGRQPTPLAPEFASATNPLRSSDGRANADACARLLEFFDDAGQRVDTTDPAKRIITRTDSRGVQHVFDLGTEEGLRGYWKLHGMRVDRTGRSVPYSPPTAATNKVSDASGRVYDLSNFNDQVDFYADYFERADPADFPEHVRHRLPGAREHFAKLRALRTSLGLDGFDMQQAASKSASLTHQLQKLIGEDSQDRLSSVDSMLEHLRLDGNPAKSERATSYLRGLIGMVHNEGYVPDLAMIQDLTLPQLEKVSNLVDFRDFTDIAREMRQFSNASKAAKSLGGTHDIVMKAMNELSSYDKEELVALNDHLVEQFDLNNLKRAVVQDYRKNREVTEFWDSFKELEIDLPRHLDAQPVPESDSETEAATAAAAAKSDDEELSFLTDDALKAKNLAAFGVAYWDSEEENEQPIGPPSDAEEDLNAMSEGERDMMELGQTDKEASGSDFEEDEQEAASDDDDEEESSKVKMGRSLAAESGEDSEDLPAEKYFTEDRESDSEEELEDDGEKKGARKYAGRDGDDPGGQSDEADGDGEDEQRSRRRRANRKESDYDDDPSDLEQSPAGFDEMERLAANQRHAGSINEDWDTGMEDTFIHQVDPIRPEGEDALVNMALPLVERMLTDGGEIASYFQETNAFLPHLAQVPLTSSGVKQSDKASLAGLNAAALKNSVGSISSSSSDPLSLYKDPGYWQALTGHEDPTGKWEVDRTPEEVRFEIENDIVPRQRAYHMLDQFKLRHMRPLGLRLFDSEGKEMNDLYPWHPDYEGPEQRPLLNDWSHEWIWRFHKAQPELWTYDRLSKRFQQPISTIAAIVKMKDIQHTSNTPPPLGEGAQQVMDERSEAITAPYLERLVCLSSLQTHQYSILLI